MKDLKEQIYLLANTNLLHPDQKLLVINNFIWPALIYPLQTAQLRNSFLKDLDALKQGAVKQICGLPVDTPTAMLYAPRNKRGLGIIRPFWEAFLQHVNIAIKLMKSQDPYLQFSKNFDSEISDCLKKLGLAEIAEDLDNFPENETSTLQITAKSLRAQLREEQFQEWCSLPQKGEGVAVFAETPDCNKWVRTKSGLSCSQWTNALKMSVNGCNLRGNPRTASSTFHCRHCGEFESLAHVLGKCPRGDLLRLARHHHVCDTIANELRKGGCTVLREDRVVTEDEGSRITDLVVIDCSSDRKMGYILDPTIRFERSTSQAATVNEEKCSIYEPTLPTYKDRFPDVSQWQVLGLLFGARGSIPGFTADILRCTFGMPRSLLQHLALDILKDSLGILHNHIYSRDQS